MPRHALTRDEQNLPVCSCGFRPGILDQRGLASVAIVGLQWKAKTDVLNHVDEVAKLEGPTAERSPEAPFRGRHAMKYPRAGVRQTEDGRWLLTLWDGDTIVHVIDEDDRTHADLCTAFSQGWLTIGACRKAGTNLNGVGV
jgi:hypothetical protein